MIENYYDIQNIKSLWYQFIEEFGRLYPNYVEEQTKNNRFFCYKVNDIVAGIASYDIHNRNKEVIIDVIAVLPLYQGLGIAKKLIHHIYKETESLYKNLNYSLKIEAYEGLPNNSFWEHMSYKKELHISKTGKSRSLYFYLDLQKLDLL